ncbi:two-component system response regulator KdpE [Methylibium sp. Pch-M]|jgi:two-component system KDP operon response regulator KdpE|uniref:two-component system response regulator KdpE n=1 Tax=Methylibium sp. Pch-M TaxID=2082386 RepID=UPI0010117CB0|nr:two-component system response regulator KdpE [Methylibium sp. Pch-M]QAZ40821.1 two-component system response regulator KdpE [Methylibium sp. Pch-M]
MSDLAPTAIIVEDEPQIRRFVRIALEGEGWLVFDAATLRQGLVEAGTRRPDLIVLDLGMPDGDGVGYLQDLRAWSQVPVIVLSARADEADKIAALDAGADDYLTKPFGVGELLARVRVARRRAQGVSDTGAVHVRFGAVDVDLASRVVARDGEPVHLTPIEYRLLTLLIANTGKVLTHRQLLREVWGPNAVEHSHYLRIYMSQLRRKLEADPARPEHLLTETGVGYRFVTRAMG